MLTKNLNADEDASETTKLSPSVNVLPPAAVSTTLSPADSVLETVTVARPLVIVKFVESSSTGCV